MEYLSQLQNKMWAFKRAYSYDPSRVVLGRNEYASFKKLCDDMQFYMMEGDGKDRVCGLEIVKANTDDFMEVTS